MFQECSLGGFPKQTQINSETNFFKSFLQTKMYESLPILITAFVLLLTVSLGPMGFFVIYLTLPITIPLLVAGMWIHHQIKVFCLANGYWQPQPPPADDSPTYEVPNGTIHPRFGSDRHALRKCIFLYKNGNPESYVHISQWDISQIKDMTFVFHNLIQTKKDNDAITGIADWDMSHVEKIDSMFSNCKAFNQPIGKWKLPRVRSLEMLFYSCISFMEPLDEWENNIGSEVQGSVNIKDVFIDTDRYWQRHPWLESLKRRNDTVSCSQ